MAGFMGKMAVFYGEICSFHGKMAVLMMFNGVLLGKVTVFNEENDDSPAHKHILG